MNCSRSRPDPPKERDTGEDHRLRLAVRLDGLCDIKCTVRFGNARSLSAKEVCALIAYVLYLNDMVTDQQSELSNKNATSITLFDACTSIDAGDKLLEHIMVLMLNTCARSH